MFGLFIRPCSACAGTVAAKALAMSSSWWTLAPAARSALATFALLPGLNWIITRFGSGASAAAREANDRVTAAASAAESLEMRIQDYLQKWVD
jgi:hypothetical protein